MKDEIQKIRKKFIKADYPRSFVNIVTSLYNNKIKEQKNRRIYLKIKNRLFY